MKVLLYSANFAPEPVGIGKYSGEMAAWLVEHGHSVRVVAAPPYYPNWEVNPNFARRAIDATNGVASMFGERRFGCRSRRPV